MLLPPRIPYFVGRSKYLQDLKDITKASVNSRICIQGMPGVGKSSLALQFAVDSSEDYPDGVFFTNFDSNSVDEIVADFYFEVAGSPPSDTSVEKALGNLFHGRNPLIILDNIDQRDNATNAIAFIKALPSCSFIITTRYGSICTDLQSKPVRVEEFRRNESLDLFHKHSIDIPDSDLNKIAEALGDLPLGIELCCGQLAPPSVYTAETFLIELAKPHSMKELLKRDIEELGKRQRSFWDCFCISLNSLNLEEKHVIAACAACGSSLHPSLRVRGSSANGYGNWVGFDASNSR